MQEKHFVGLDCGNSSFRTLLGTYNGKTITTQVIDQIPNDMVRIGQYYYWDLLRIFDGFKTMLKKIVKSGVHIDSIGVCTWGVDFALFDKSGVMLLNPLSYRNQHGATYLAKMTEEQKADIFLKSGIICDKINSVFLMQAIKDNIPGAFNAADKILMIPDILNYFLTGCMQNEPSEFSTTQLFSAKNRAIDEDICNFFDIPKNLFCKVGKHGDIIGYVEKGILDEIGADYDIPVVCVPSHDTASAVAAIPAKESNFAFISSGTWSLIGTELDEPVITQEVLQSGLTNEVGAFNKITLLKNSAGMFIIQRIKKEYDCLTGQENKWDDLDVLADEYTKGTPLFNINNERFFNPSSMSDEIWAYLSETEQVKGKKDWGAIIKAVHHSMACCYAVTIANMEKVTQKIYSSVYIVGGGSKNVMVNKLTAQYTGKSVIACSKESTALGNIATQINASDKNMSLDKIRAVIAASTQLKTYNEPQSSTDLVDKYKILP